MKIEHKILKGKLKVIDVKILSEKYLVVIGTVGAFFHAGVFLLISDLNANDRIHV